MSLALTGSSQYVSLGDAIDVYSTLPITVAAVVQSASIASTLIGVYSQGNYSANRGYGCFAYGGPPKKLGCYGSPASLTIELDGANNLITTDDGWYLVLYTFRTSAGNLDATVSVYSYDHTTWSSEHIGTGNAATSFTAPSAGDTTVIGANLISSVSNFWNTNYSWIFISDQDYGTDPSVNANAQELVANGFWNLLNAHCKLAIAFNNNTTDQSGGGHNGTLIGSPSYTTTGPGEVAPSVATTGFMTTLTNYWGP